jgi:glycosyltransferase involved in cell wall biosynthesis
MVDSRRRVVLVANSTWNIVNFREGLIGAVREAGYEPIVIAPDDPGVKDRMAALGVERYEVRLDRGGLNPFADLRLLLSYRRLLGELRPAAFLGFTIKPNIYGTLAAKSLKIPAIPNVSGLGTAFIGGGPLERIVAGLYRVAFRGLRSVFFQNPDDQALFIERRIIRADQAKLIPGSGINLDRYRPAPIPDGPFTFLLIARLLGDKGVREYVAAAKLLRPQVPGVRFQLLGPLDEQNRTAIARAELDEWVAEGAIEYLGPAEDIRPAIAQASAVVLPSYREGMPRSLLEAAAMGRPLVATDVPGCRHLVDEGVTGFLCEAKNAASLANALQKMVHASPAERQAMGETARKRVQAEFSESLVIRAYLDALEQVGAARS